MVVIITKCNIKANIPFLIKKGTYMLVFPWNDYKQDGYLYASFKENIITEIL